MFRGHVVECAKNVNDTTALRKRHDGHLESYSDASYTLSAGIKDGTN